MRIINNYIFRQVAGATFMVLLVVFGLDFVFRLANELGQIHGNYTFMTAVAYVLLGSPLQFYSVMPLIGMIGCIVGLGTLASTSELIILRTSGISTIKLTWFALKPTLVFLLLAVLVGEFVAPKTEVMADNMKTIARMGVDKIDLTRLLWLRDKNSFIFVNIVTPESTLSGVNIFDFNDDQNLVRLRAAKTATYNGKDGWQLQGVTITHFNGEGSEINNISMTQKATDFWATDIRPDLLKIAVASPRDLPINELYRYINYLDSQSLNDIEYRLAFWEKIFYPLVVVSLILVGIAFVFGPLREVTMGYRLFCGVMVGVLVKTLQTAVGPISIVFGLSPVFAMSIPSILCATLGIYLLYRLK